MRAELVCFFFLHRHQGEEQGTVKVLEPTHTIEYATDRSKAEVLVLLFILS